MEILGIYLARYSSGGEAAFSGLVIGAACVIIGIIYNAIKKWMNKD